MKGKKEIADRSVKVDWQTHRQLKLEAAQRGMTIRKMIAEWMERRRLHARIARRDGEKASEQTR